MPRKRNSKLNRPVRKAAAAVAPPQFGELDPRFLSLMSKGSPSLQKGGTDWKSIAESLAARAVPAMGKTLWDRTAGLASKIDLRKLLPKKAKPGMRKISALPRNESGPVVSSESTGALVSVARPKILRSQSSKLSVGLGSSGQISAVAGVAQTIETPTVGWTMTSGGGGPGGHDSICLEGTDFLDSVRPSTSAPGTVINQFYLNPRFLGLQRLAQMAALFERFHFEHFEMVYCQATPTSTSGGMVCFYELDPDDLLPQGLNAALRAAFGHYGVGTTNYWTGARFVLPPNPGEYFCDPGVEGRLVYQGIFTALVEVACNLSSTTGVWMCRYKCRLWQSKLDSSANNSLITVGNGDATTATNTYPFGTSGAIAYSTLSAGDYLAAYNVGGGASNFVLVPGFSAWKVEIDVKGANCLTLLVQSAAGSTTWSHSTPYNLDSDWDSLASSTAEIAYTGLWLVDNPNLPASFFVSMTTFTTPSVAKFRFTPVSYSTFANKKASLEAKLSKLAKSLSSVKQQVELLADPQAVQERNREVEENASPPPLSTDLRINARDDYVSVESPTVSLRSVSLKGTQTTSSIRRLESKR